METLYIWPNMPALSMTALIVGSMLFLFLARTPIHKALESLTDGSSGGLQEVANWAYGLANKIKERDRKVLLESGVTAHKHKLLDEFQRVDISFSKNLAEYPGLQRRLDDHISKLEADYSECGQAVPEAPGWNDAVASIAQLPGTSGDRVIEKMLTEIHKSAVDGEKRALAELRNTTAQRHKILSGMATTWKLVDKLLKDIGGKIGGVLETSERMDKYMTDFQKINKGNEESIDMLSSRANRMFIATSIVMAAAVAGAFVNFNLIALPMSEMVPAGSRVLGMPVSSFSALIIILLEFVTGIFFWESVRFTHIIPQIGMLPSSRRRWITYLSLLFLLLLAGVEASLGFLREIMAEKDAVIEQQMAGAEIAVTGAAGSVWAKYGQAGLGFALPLILAMTMMALENFIETSQHAASKLMALVVTLFGHICRMLSFVLGYIIKIFMHLYDAYIIVPLQLSNLVTRKAIT
ncbi:hypothetical protein FKG94_12670 [Exilibacterium tricleocarpae]|uniref:Uncharacterized protein n=1 Tax=Exilibacterium tricleocarpae TaxID=2591008 RepID=A0A545TNS8_9GAMM|nr:hypothetical protein [Exilibacterium tricleocarpae]TQV78866.1 hypothetical protein FKG94_12670 [Exilibacterium tricleocarpae]